MSHEEKMKALLQSARRWLKRSHTGRTSEEKQAYLEALQDALDEFGDKSIFKDLESFENLFYPD